MRSDRNYLKALHVPLTVTRNLLLQNAMEMHRMEIEIEVGYDYMY